MSNELKVQDDVSYHYASKRYKDYGLKYHSYVIADLMKESNGKILDLGCGIGILSDLYPNKDIIGVDISDGMLSFNKNRWVKASAENLPFSDGYFDFVVCRSLLHHLPSALVGLKEIFRVLKKGGKVVMWETNKSWLAEKVRAKTHHGDHFSEYHTSFDNLPNLVSALFKIESVKYEGLLAYGLYGFRDIVDLSKYTKWAFKYAVKFDEWLSRSWFKKVGFAVQIKAMKP